MKLQEIVQINDSLRTIVERGGNVRNFVEAWDYMHALVSQIINGDLPGFPSTVKPKKPTRGICQRMKGKQGRFRCVIVDVCLPFDQLCAPVCLYAGDTRLPESTLGNLLGCASAGKTCLANVWTFVGGPSFRRTLTSGCMRHASLLCSPLHSSIPISLPLLFTLCCFRLCRICRWASLVELPSFSHTPSV